MAYFVTLPNVSDAPGLRVICLKMILFTDSTSIMSMLNISFSKVEKKIAKKLERKLTRSTHSLELCTNVEQTSRTSYIQSKWIINDLFKFFVCTEIHAIVLPRTLPLLTSSTSIANQSFYPVILSTIIFKTYFLNTYRFKSSRCFRQLCDGILWNET